METMQSDELWERVLARDPAADGRFVYGVRSTGIYCRPTCPSRRPLRRNVRFFPDAAGAERAGFRPCRRCHGRPEPDWPAVLRRACQLLAGDTLLLEEEKSFCLVVDGLVQVFAKFPLCLSRDEEDNEERDGGQGYQLLTEAKNGGIHSCINGI